MAALQNGPGGIAGLGDTRPVNFWLLGLMARSGAGTAAFENVRAHTLGFVRLNRAGVGLLLRNANFHESIEYRFTLYFQLTR